MREFKDEVAKRERVPLWFGIMGPSGGGKTFSALRVATGIVSISGGEIYVVDTEARRALHYADAFSFKHVDFKAPFGSLDYLAAVGHCVSRRAGVVILDSVSHEHEGPGGYLMTQEAEIDRMAGDDWNKRERVKMASWIKPSAMRQKMVNGLLQQNVHMIFCFRAKEKTKPMTVSGKMQVVELGFMPIAGEALLYEMTACALLLPKANGIPTWQTQNVGERQMMKLPKQFARVFTEGRQLDEKLGVELATWARGDKVEPGVGSVPSDWSEPDSQNVPRQKSEPNALSGSKITSEPRAESVPITESEPYNSKVTAAVSEPNAENVPQDMSEPRILTGASQSSEPHTTNVTEAASEPPMAIVLAEAAARGTAALQEAWRGVPKQWKAGLKERLDSTWKPIAKKIDLANGM